jgi:predicted transcriptional regulator
MKIKISVVFLLLSTFCINPLFPQSGGLIGRTVSSLQLIDPDDNPKAIPAIGEKVIMILYTDPDEKDINDPLSNAVKAKNFPDSKYLAVGVANCKDTWIPNAGIRMKARQKQKQFPTSVVLLDEDKVLPKTWGLGNCDDMGVIIIIGKDRKVKYISYVKTQDQSREIIGPVIKILTEEIAK